MTPAEAMTAMLEALAPSQRPFGYGRLLDAAQALTPASAAQASAILGILGTSQFARIATPPPLGVPLSFPGDHRIHLENSDEWYWASANLTASDGVTQVGVLMTTQNSRLIPQDIQALAGWSDAECHVVSSSTTIMVNNGSESRIVRGQTLSLKQKEFIEAARAAGLGRMSIVARHIIPNLLGPVAVYVTLTIPAVILAESFLSFLGLGVQPPMASLGTLISAGAQDMEMAWWLLVFPALAMAATLAAFNFIGDGLRDALDPKDR
jgi:hypothetical protein